jgi:hypothetical protein
VGVGRLPGGLRRAARKTPHNGSSPPREKWWPSLRSPGPITPPKRAVLSRVRRFRPWPFCPLGEWGRLRMEWHAVVPVCYCWNAARKEKQGHCNFGASVLLSYYCCPTLTSLPYVSFLVREFGFFRLQHLCAQDAGVHEFWPKEKRGPSPCTAQPKTSWNKRNGAERAN